MRNGWQTARLSDVSAINYGYTESASSDPIGPRFLRITDIQDDSVDWDSVPYCPIDLTDLPKYRLASGDIVFARTGATTGKSFLVHEPPEAVFASYLIRLRLRGTHLLPEFVSLFFQTADYWQSIKDGSSGSAQGGFNATKLGELSIPVPPLAEQQQIVGLLDEAFEGIAAVKAHAEKNLQNARALFESHLNSTDGPKVSLGELVNIESGDLDSNEAVEGGQYPFFTCSREPLAIDRYKFDCEAILLAGNNASADFNVKHYVGKFCARQRTYVITVRASERALCRFLYFELLKGLATFKQQAVGMGTKFIKLGMVQNLKVALPSLSQQKARVRLLNEVRAETQGLATLYARKLAALEALKKSLLHQAFSGEL